MKKYFPEPLAVKNQEPPYKPDNGKNSPWDFRTPHYDQRHSVFIQAGTDYGHGVNQPVGHKGNPKQFVQALPVNSVKMIKADDKEK